MDSCKAVFCLQSAYLVKFFLRSPRPGVRHIIPIARLPILPNIVVYYPSSYRDFGGPMFPRKQQRQEYFHKF